MITCAPFPAHNAIVFNDAFGTTRVSLPKKVKTVRNFTNVGLRTMVPLQDAVVLAGLSYPYASKLCTVPDLKGTTVKFVDSKSVAFSQDGTQLYDIGAFPKEGAYHATIRSLSVSALDRRGMNGARSQDSPNSVQPLPVFNLGGDVPLKSQFGHVWDDGHWVARAWDGLAGGTLSSIVGSPHAIELNLNWALPIRHGLDPLRMEMRAEGNSVWLMGESVDEDVAVLARIGRDGASEVWRFDALEAPGYHDGWVGLRVGDNEFVRFQLAQPNARDTFTADPEHLALDGGIDPNTKRKHKRHPKVVDYRGRVMMLGNQLLYLPWHAESILNLTAASPKDALIPRKLPVKERDIRTFVSRDAAAIRGVARALKGSVQLSRVWVKKGKDKKKLHVTWEHNTDTVGRQFWAMCLDATMYHHYIQYRVKRMWSPGGTKYGGINFIDRKVGLNGEPITVDEVRAGLTALEACGVSALGLCGAIYREMQCSKAGNNITVADLFHPGEARHWVAEAILAAACGTHAQDPPISTKDALEARLSERKEHLPIYSDWKDPVAVILGMLLDEPV